MAEPTIICPNCKTEIKLIERLMQLNDIAIGQIRSLMGNSAIKRLTGSGRKTGKDQ